MKPYGDSNFFTRLYLLLPDTPKALALLEEAARSSTVSLPISWLHRVEITNAFQLHVFAGRTPGQTRVTPEQTAAALASFREEIPRLPHFRQIVLSPSNLENLFTELSLRHTAKHGFRTYDILHVASALLLDCDTFWSFDPKAAKLAALEGLKTNLEIRM